ncbi:MAG: hypothetical protein KZY74_11400 [Paenibacillaceae bacterium]|nr:hypothetical protein [Paenibacillaceae bacterium]
MAKVTEVTLRSQVVYSVYVRNHSPEGTFWGVERDLGRIRELGVDIVWLLPIHPIGLEARKGELGSPYANRDYREINPELGTREDFESLVEAIHRHGMKCIIDMVYNHTSPDSWLVQHRPDYFYTTPEGKRGNRVGDWGDIVDLDYGQAGLWDYQIDTLKMWAGIVDGFRCDVAPLLPLEFWLRAREEVAKVKPDCLWLAESIEPEFLLHLRSRGLTALSDAEILQAFDVCYDYDTYPWFAGYLSGDNALSAYADKLNQQEHLYPANYVKLRFLENHDRPRAAKLISDEGSLINWTAFLYFLKGMPLLYGGQETQSEVCPDLFGRQPVDWSAGKDLSWLLKTLYAIKKKPILAYGLCRWNADDALDLLAGTYAWGERKLAGVFSLKGKPGEAEVDLPDGVYADLIGGGEIAVIRGKVRSEGKPVILEF